MRSIEMKREELRKAYAYKRVPLGEQFTLGELANWIHKESKAQDLWENGRHVSEIVMLCQSELAGALQEVSQGREPNEVYRYCAKIGKDSGLCNPKTLYDCSKLKEEYRCEHRGKQVHGAPVELIKCMIRILDYLAYLKVDVDKLLKEVAIF